jgi:hypothetical protein
VVVTQPEDLTAALQHVLADDTLARLRTSAQRLVPVNGADEAAYVISDRRSA